MKRSTLTSFALAWVVALFAAAGLAQTHIHGDAAGPLALELDHGRKWPTDAPLRRYMADIRKAIDGAPRAAHSGTAPASAYRTLALRVEHDVAGIVAECKLAPAADAMLHKVVAALLAGADAMKSASGGTAAREGLIQVSEATDAYGKYFAHPGWRAPAH